MNILDDHSTTAALGSEASWLPTLHYQTSLLLYYSTNALEGEGYTCTTSLEMLPTATQHNNNRPYYEIQIYSVNSKSIGTCQLLETPLMIEQVLSCFLIGA
jgi:hypothetical protein